MEALGALAGLLVLLATIALNAIVPPGDAPPAEEDELFADVLDEREAHFVETWWLLDLRLRARLLVWVGRALVRTDQAAEARRKRWASGTLRQGGSGR